MQLQYRFQSYITDLMQYQQKIRKAEKLIPHFKILILQFILQNIIAKNKYQLKICSLHSLIQYKSYKLNLQNQNSYSSHCIPFSINNMQRNPNDQFRTKKEHEYKYTYQHSKNYKKKDLTEIIPLNEQMLIKNKSNLIFHNSNQNYFINQSNIMQKRQNSSKTIFNQQQKNYQIKNHLSQIKASKQKMNSQQQSKKIKKNRKDKEKQINQIGKTMQKCQNDFNNKSKLNEQQISLTSKIAIYLIKNIMKNMLIRGFDYTFQQLKVCFFIDRKFMGTRQKYLERKLYQKDEYIFELQSDLFIKQQEIEQMKKVIDIYKKYLKKKIITNKKQFTDQSLRKAISLSNHKLQISNFQQKTQQQTFYNLKSSRKCHKQSYPNNSRFFNNPQFKFIVQDNYHPRFDTKTHFSNRSNNSSKFSGQEKSISLRRGNKQKQFKLIYRIEKEEDNHERSFKIQLTQDDFSIRNFQFKTNYNLNEQKKGLKNQANMQQL